ncbi:MAG: aromatic-ring-hydroxylating dioxygenase subunit beta [Alphaproteobacteria bacterium]|nr:aromatic-ring-hydroxylating dioxygenase subunit beta [Alphaproteobacteria bacterium]MCW5742015.1 aromatic-ring-hydroxylating dioxygenase subunit beta [Alphaproteobacteria bacterium]
MNAAHDYRLIADVMQFIYREARLQDEHEYEAWEALWAEDAIYWIPAGDTIDPDKSMSIVYDNRSRIALRVKQLLTGRHFSQSPRSALRRVVSNVEVIAADGDTVRAAANAMLFESNIKGETLWASRNEYTLRRAGDDFLMARKKVDLVNKDKALFSMAFLM